MSRVFRVVHVGLFTAVMTGSLTFGAAQAFARPAKGESAVRACTSSSCNEYCRSQYGPESTGFCWYNSCNCS